MALITSISGIRGTIGGKAGENFTPVDIVKYVSLFAQDLKKRSLHPKIVVGRDARISGKFVKSLVTGTLISMGCEVLDLDLATTPTTEMAVIVNKADGGIIITASHNPENWNALKFLNHKGEFLNKNEIKFILEADVFQDVSYADVNKLGEIKILKDFVREHIRLITELELVDVEAIRKAGFKVAVDCINSVGAVSVPLLLETLGVKDIVKINCEPDGRFAHTPEPLPENLKETAKIVAENHCDVGFVVDPDVDRLSIICEDGSFFGEEYTLVAVADYVLQNTPGNTVSNLSSTIALKEITEKYGGKYYASAVGEINVVEKMKEVNAVIGGEGNGGVIYPALHYGRDALVGIALFLSYLAKKGVKTSQLRKLYPNYIMLKRKIDISKIPSGIVDEMFQALKEKYKDRETISIDGLKIFFNDGWIHIRKSNTEPIVRIYAEAFRWPDFEEKIAEISNFITTFEEKS